MSISTRLYQLSGGDGTKFDTRWIYVCGWGWIFCMGMGMGERNLSPPRPVAIPKVWYSYSRKTLFFVFFAKQESPGASIVPPGATFLTSGR